MGPFVSLMGNWSDNSMSLQTNINKFVPDVLANLGPGAKSDADLQLAANSLLDGGLTKQGALDAVATLMARSQNYIQTAQKLVDSQPMTKQQFDKQNAVAQDIMSEDEFVRNYMLRNQ